MSNDQMTLDELLAYCTDGHRPEREIPVSFILPVLRDLIARAERAEAALARVEAVLAEADALYKVFHERARTGPDCDHNRGLADGFDQLTERIREKMNETETQTK